jgi:predicted nucleic acid-binding Zn finger protein
MGAEGLRHLHNITNPQKGEAPMTTTSRPHVTQIARIKALRDRLIKAEELVKAGKVHPAIDIADHWVVEGSNGHYLVNQNCPCPDFVNRTDLIETYCKHRLAAMLYAGQAKSSEQDTELERKVSELYN